MTRAARAASRGSVVALAIVFAIVLVAALSVPVPAAADPQAEAIVLFDQGIKDMKAGRLDKACAELQASLQLVKDSGTKGALARCHGRAGRLATAWLLWRELGDTAPTADLRNDAAAQAAKLERRLPRYTIKLAGKTPGLTVQVNGRDVALDVQITVPIDPGPVSVVAVGRDGDRPTTKRFTRDYTAVEGEVLEIEVPVLDPLPAPRSTPAASPPVTSPRLRTPPPDTSSDLAATRHRRHVIALAIGGVALISAGGGTLFGLQARSRYADAKRVCGGTIDHCLPDQLTAAQSRVDASRRSALYSNVAFGVAGAAALTAIIVWATAPSLESRPLALAPTATPNSLGLVLTGAL